MVMMYYVKLHVESRLCITDPQYLPKTARSVGHIWVWWRTEEGRGRKWAIKRRMDHTHAALSHSYCALRVTHHVCTTTHTHLIHSPEQKLWISITRVFCTCEVVKCSKEVEIVCGMLSVCCGLTKAWVTTHLLAVMTLITAHTHTHTSNYVVLLCHCTVETKATGATK